MKYYLLYILFFCFKFGNYVIIEIKSNYFGAFFFPRNIYFLNLSISCLSRPSEIINLKIKYKTNVLNPNSHLCAVNVILHEKGQVSSLD